MGNEPSSNLHGQSDVDERERCVLGAVRGLRERTHATRLASRTGAVRNVQGDKDRDVFGSLPELRWQRDGRQENAGGRVSYRVICADALLALAEMAENSVDALVTDPPAGIEFMRKDWDSFRGDRRQPEDDTFSNSTSGPHIRAKVRYGTSAGYGNQNVRENFIASMQAVFAECLRVLKPGAHGLVWALPRTSHWTATALENAGFEVRDVVTHLFGSGFPKNLDLSKAIDKLHGAQREKKRVEYKGELMRHGGENTRPWMDAALEKGYHECPGDEPASVDAKTWNGWGTALKPASEHWILIRKPIAEKNIAANVLRHGTGAINIDGSRISVDGEDIHAPQSDPRKRGGVVGSDLGISAADREKFQSAQRASVDKTQSLGRFPANVVFSHTPFCERTGTKQVRSDGNWRGDHAEDHGYGFNAEHRIEQSIEREDGRETVEVWECVTECPVRMLDEQSGERPVSGSAKSGRPATGDDYGKNNVVFGTSIGRRQGALHNDCGGASRFFFVAKPSSAEKHDALQRLSLFDADPHAKPEKNAHPTVKPVELMRYFIRMVTPPGGTVLDCFGGSGTTGIAAILEGFDVTLIEREPDYARTAEARMAQAALERGAA